MKENLNSQHIFVGDPTSIKDMHKVRLSKLAWEGLGPKTDFLGVMKNIVQIMLGRPSSIGHDYSRLELQGG